MGDRNAELYGGEGDCDGGIHVADDKDEIRLTLNENGLDAFENFGGLRGMRAGTNLEIDVRRGNAHLPEENVGKSFVIMLAGVDKDRFDLRMALHLADERSDLGEIGAGAHDVDDFQAAAREIVE